MKWNGICQKQRELQMFLGSQNIDVGLISETHLTNQSYVKLRGYKIYHTVHPLNNARGGSAVVIKENIVHYEEEQYQTDAIQATAGNIKTGKYNFVACAVYCPPSFNLKKEHYL